MTASHRIVVDETKCTGCRICELACSSRKHGAFGPVRSRVRILKLERFLVDIPLTCKQCPEPPCVDSCPVEALTGDEHGVIRVSADSCTGCKSCLDACPFEAISLDPVLEKASVCDLCDGEPECAKWCPTGALQYVRRPEREAHESRTPLLIAEDLLRTWGVPLEELRKYLEQR